MVPSVDSGQVGFGVAPGDPSAISDSAAAHQELADALELHYATIRGAASDVVGLWNGEASSSYQNLAHFGEAGGSAGDGPSVGAAGAVGTYRGSTIWDAEGTIGLSAQPDASAHSGVSDTVVLP